MDRDIKELFLALGFVFGMIILFIGSIVSIVSLSNSGHHKRNIECIEIGGQFKNIQGDTWYCEK